MKTVNIAEKFTPFPGGRFASSGKGSGEEFRQNFLVPALEKGEVTEIILDGASGYPASFLEEAFGGLVRLGFTKDQILSLIKIRASAQYETYNILIHQYIDDASRRTGRH